MNRLPDTPFAPAREAFVDGIGLAKALREVLPGCAGSGDPEDGVNKKAVIGCVSARFAGLPRQQGGDAFKVVVGYGVAMHEHGRVC